MKKIVIVILTMLIETGLLWAISILINWELMEFLFLGSILLFAIPWLFLYFNTQNQNAYNVSAKGITGQDAGGVKLFRFRFSPIMTGLVLYMVLSLCLTIFYYYEYFI
ncbi:hypothetical protein ACFQ38_11410 [Sporosarcina contaminans]|uniref:DUF3899 domain-containing protein n=1 Tax=Sporosarcina contaminans TaxID=633403 RepID=A0ABW3U262_9BACL